MVLIKIVNIFLFSSLIILSTISKIYGAEAFIVIYIGDVENCNQAENALLKEELIKNQRKGLEPMIVCVPDKKEKSKRDKND